MGKKARRGPYITARDMALFDYLLINKVATAKQINRDIFCVSDLRNVLRRLRFLAKSGYIGKTPVEEEVMKHAYYLTNQTFQRYLSKRTERHWTQLKSESRAHDVTLVNIRKRFLRCKKVTSYLTENAIESGIDCPASFPALPFIEMHCDGAIVFNNTGRTFNIAIEYEDSPKARARYTSHFQAYYIRPEIHGVIYIVKDDKLRDVLLGIDKRFCANRKSKIFFGKLSEVLSHTKPLHFSNNTGNILKIA